MKAFRAPSQPALLLMCLLLACSAPRCGGAPWKQNANQTAARDMARSLLTGSFNAGSGYADVWVRDTATFLHVAAEVNDRDDVKRVLLRFLSWQREDGEVPGGYILNATANHSVHAFPPCLGGTIVCKNTAETDQESSLVIAFSHYVNATGDRSVLSENIDGIPVITRLESALQWMLDNRVDPKQPSLLYGATTMDWGDVQPEAGLVDERMLGPGSHPSLDVYDNAMFVLAVRALLHLQSLVPPSSGSGTLMDWPHMLQSVSDAVRAVLWDADAKQYRPHVYLDKGSPFPSSFAENSGGIFCSGSTWVAAQAGLLTTEELQAVLARANAIVRDVAATGGDVTLGITIYPPYPSNLTTHMMAPWTYQNGGDWAWFGGRLVSALVQYGLVDEAEAALQPMVDRVVAHGGFFEWWDRSGRPSGSAKFHGAAGVLAKAVEDVARARAR